MPSQTLPARDTLPASGTWDIDPTHSSVEAVARHLVVSKVRGRFTSFSGSIVIAEDITESVVDASIDATSVDTGSAERDGHLRSADFLDVDNHPTLTFHAEQVRHVSGDQWQVPGELTLRGVTRPVTLDVSYLGTAGDPWGGTRAGFEATAELDREDFDITWNQALETGGVLLGKTLKIELDIQLVAQG